MLNYILKRTLLMIPTLFAIVLIVFVLVNIAPGTPGQAQSASGTESVEDSANAREGYRLFKLQYHLDKPIIVNTRWRLGVDQVLGALKVSAEASNDHTMAESLALHIGAQSARVIEAQLEAPHRALQAELAKPDLSDARRAELQQTLQDLPPTQVDRIRPPRPPQGDVIRAENNLENWGQEIVPYLLQIATQYVALRDADGERHDVFLPHPALDEAALRAGAAQSFGGKTARIDAARSLKIRKLATDRLAVNARRRAVVGEGERASEERIAQNRAIARENAQIAQWTYPLTATPEERAENERAWTTWFEAHKDERYTQTVGSRVQQTFLDTRFAHYIGNLMPFDLHPTFRVRAPDLGTSMRYRRPVLDVIGEHWRYSVGLSLISLLLAYVIAIPIGVIAAVRHNGPIADRGVGILLFVLYSLPVFFGATLLQTWLTPARGLDWFPVSGFDDGRSLERTAIEHLWVVTKHLVLPVICLTYPSLAALSRYARSGLLEVIRADYIRTARAKGLPEWVVITRHAVRNGMIPIITLLGSTLPVVIGGSIVIEYIFAIEGMGALMLQSIGQRDYNVILGVLMLSSVLTLIGILLSDIAYALIDPRISYD